MATIRPRGRHPLAVPWAYFLTGNAHAVKQQLQMILRMGDRVISSKGRIIDILAHTRAAQFILLKAPPAAGRALHDGRGQRR